VSAQGRHDTLRLNVKSQLTMMKMSHRVELSLDKPAFMPESF